MAPKTRTQNVKLTKLSNGRVLVQRTWEPDDVGIQAAHRANRGRLSRYKLAHLVGVSPLAVVAALGNRERLPTHNSKKTHCSHGHPFSTENTYVDGRGHRLCRTCRKTRDARRIRRKNTTKLP